MLVLGANSHVFAEENLNFWSWPRVPEHHPCRPHTISPPAPLCPPALLGTVQEHHSCPRPSIGTACKYCLKSSHYGQCQRQGKALPTRLLFSLIPWSQVPSTGTHAGLWHLSSQLTQVGPVETQGVWLSPGKDLEVAPSTLPSPRAVPKKAVLVSSPDRSITLIATMSLVGNVSPKAQNVKPVKLPAEKLPVLFHGNNPLLLPWLSCFPLWSPAGMLAAGRAAPQPAPHSI